MTSVDGITSKLNRMLTSVDAITDIENAMQTSVQSITNKENRLPTSADAITNNDNRLPTSVDAITNNENRMPTSVDAITNNENRTPTSFEGIPNTENGVTTAFHGIPNKANGLGQLEPLTPDNPVILPNAPAPGNDFAYYFSGFEKTFRGFVAGGKSFGRQIVARGGQECLDTMEGATKPDHARGMNIMSTIRNAAALLMLAIGLACITDRPSFGDEAAGEIHKLPAPLEDIFVNSSDFEDRGYFEVAKLQFNKAAVNKQDSFVWTLRANQSMTFRHVEVFLERFRHAHFYSRVKNVGRPAYSTLLNYSPALEIDAANGEILPRGGSIDVWINVSPVDVAKIRGAKATSLVLGAYTRR